MPNSVSVQSDNKPAPSDKGSIIPEVDNSQASMPDQEVTDLQSNKSENVGGLKSIISIDAGRKYVSVEELKRIVDKAHVNGYTGMSLVLGNDGLRFLLDDMTVEVNNVTYSSDDVKKGILEGNKDYYDDPNGNALTQSQMDDFIQYTSSKNFEIIPAINTPGHMDALIVAMKHLKINNPEFKISKRTIDLDNEVAVKFSKAIVTKYIEYFSNSCQIFNIGLDEYANDIPQGGWKAIQKSGTYKKFVEYANSLSGIVKRGGMQPMAFNDGVYYNSKDSFGTFDKDIIIAYWTSGWSGYDVATANTLVEKGHKILNTNDSWYWVLGRKSRFDGIYNLNQAIFGIETLAFTKVTGASVHSVPIIGSMQGIWADKPQYELNLKDLFDLMDAYSRKHSNYLTKPAATREDKENELSNNSV